MKLNKLLVIGVAAVTFVGTALEASAAGLRDIFNAEYYAAQYSDLKEAFGDDEAMLYQHFITCGLNEGRNMNPILDVAAYREAYKDLDEAYGDDWDKYVEHFFASGARENREEGVMFNPIQYAAAYSDVEETAGDDLLSIVKHYLTIGMAENREEGTSKGYKSIAAMKAAGTKEDNNQAPAATAATAPTTDPEATASPAPTVTPEESSGEEAVYNAIMAMQGTYPEGTSWTNDNVYIWKAFPNVIYKTAGCAAFAAMLSDAAFGEETMAHEAVDVSKVRVGDIVRLDNSHSVIILKVADNGDVTVAEGNYNNSVHWGRIITRAELEASFNYLYTRY